MAKAKKGSKQASNQPSRAASGTATPVVQEPLVPVTTVIGINFGQSFSSIAVINKEGLADCIANDDGERQIATALSFNGEEEYSGVPARVQLVRNPENTILAFRNLLGKTYDEVKGTKQPSSSAPIVDSNGTPAFTVSINGAPVTLTVHQVSVRFLTVLLSYATDFLGRKITGAVLSVPAFFTPVQISALKKAAHEAGITVVQTIPEAASALTAYHSTDLVGDAGSKHKSVDQNVVVVDVGGSSTTVSVFAVRDGLFAPLASSTDASLGGDLYDAKLMDWFGKEFTKKTRIPIEASNHRALTKLRLAVEVTKKSLSASNSAPCSVESLADGMDFHGSINRTRFDLLSGSVNDKIVAKVEATLAEAKLDPLHIQELILVGGTSRLPKLIEKLTDLFPSTVTVKSEIDPDEVIAKGAALQAISLVTTYPLDSKLAVELHSRAHTEQSVVEPHFLVKPIGLVTEAPKGDARATPEGKLFTTLVAERTPLPLRRVIDIPVPTGSSAAQVLISLWEGSHEIKSEAPPPKSKPGLFSRVTGIGAKDEDDEEDDEEPEDIRTASVVPENQIGELVVKVETKPAAGSKGPARVRLTIIVESSGKGTATAVQLLKSGAETVTLSF